VVLLSPADVQNSCAAFFDDLADGRLVVRRHPALDAAVVGVTRQVIGDAWRWARRDVSDITPLMACTLAHWSATRRRERRATPNVVDPWSVDVE
jgi:hypothetical protein